MEQIIDDAIVLQLHEALLSDKARLDAFKRARGLNLATIKKFKIGWDKASGRYTIPIPNVIPGWANIRKYKLGAVKPTPKFLPWAEGLGSHLFPIFALSPKNTDKTAIICEGECDCMMLHQAGFMAVTETAGSLTWNDEWSVYFAGWNVVIIYDCDDAGRKGAEIVRTKLLDTAANIKVVDLGLGDGEDITDWFVKHNRTADELVELIKATTPVDTYTPVPLEKSMEAIFFNKRIKFNGIIVGKDLSPFLIPKIVKAECIGSRGKDKCLYCPLSSHRDGIEHEYSYQKDRYELIKMIGASDDQIMGIIKKTLRLPSSSNCREIKIETLERMNVEEIQIIPELTYDSIDKEYVTRRCYYFGIGIQTNQSYLCRGTTWADPNNQSGIHLIRDVKGSRDSISRWVITDDIFKELKKFQPEKQSDETSINERIKDIHSDFSANITKIVGREDILMGLELTYHSILRFNFLGDTITKGWLEFLVIGDTKCGKTETIKNMVHHYMAGEFVTSGENTTRAGLLGGAQQSSSGRWTITWGKLPLNDRRLVVIDEADNLAENEIIGLLSGVRSSGIAELVLIQPQKTMARTRIVWIANPLHGKMNEHNYGVLAIKELFGKQQDISRIDMAVGVAREDISDDIINSAEHESYEHKYTSEMCHNRIMWAWNKGPDDVVWMDSADRMILAVAQEFGERYSSDIPLAIGAEMRMKIARMSVGLAASLFSTEEKGEKVLVYPSHVFIVAKWLKKQYDNHVLGFYDYSDKRRREGSLTNEYAVQQIVDTEEQINMLLDTDQFQLSDFEVIFNKDRERVRGIIGELRKCGAVRKVHTFYKKTPSFIGWLKKRKGAFRKLAPLLEGGNSNGNG